MKKINKSPIIILLAALFFQSKITNAQFEKKATTTTKEKLNAPPSNEAYAKQIIEIVKPVKEKIENLLKEDNSGTYENYKSELKRLNDMKNNDEKSKLVKTIYNKYFDFFKKIWLKAEINEADYQAKIKKIFPPEVQETIKFTEFLNFSSSSQSQKPAPPPAPPPSPSRVCIDATDNFFIVQVLSQGIMQPWILSGKNFVAVGTATSIAGHNTATGAIISDIKIPGTFPGDSKKLQITKSYLWNAEATAISVLGCSFANIGTSTDNFLSDKVDITTWAPVIFISTLTKNEVRSIQTLINKQFMLNIRFGVSVTSNCFAEIIAGSYSSSSCKNLMWSECEE